MEISKLMTHTLLLQIDIMLLNTYESDDESEVMIIKINTLPE